MLKHKNTYEIIAPEDIGLHRSNESGIVLGKLRYVVAYLSRKLNLQNVWSSNDHRGSLLHVTVFELPIFLQISVENTSFVLPNFFPSRNMFLSHLLADLYSKDLHAPSFHDFFHFLFHTYWGFIKFHWDSWPVCTSYYFLVWSLWNLYYLFKLFFCFNLHIILLIDLFVHLIIFYVFLAPEYTWLAYNWFFKVNLGTNLKNIGNLPVNWRTLKILVVYTDKTCSCAKKYHTNAFKGPKKSWMKISVRIEKI